MAPTLRNRRLLFLGILVVGLLAGGMFERCRAQTFCNLIADPSVGNCVDELIIHAGESPFALTLIAPDTLVAVDLFTANFYKYDMLGNSTAFPTPLGGGQHTGVAYHPVEDALYWIIDSGTGQQLVKSDNNGVHLSTVPLTGTPGGFIGDFTWNDNSASFWGVDIVNDVVFEFNAMGVSTGTTFPQPGLTPFGGGVFGTGIASVPDTTGQNSVLFDIVTGQPTDQRPRRLARADSTGSDRGIGYDFSSTTGLNGWVTGLAFQSTTNGGPFEYVANTTDNRISRTIATELTGFLPTPVDFTCSSDEDGNVTLSWTNLATYSQVEILRDGTSLVVDTSMLIAFGPQTYVDVPVDPGALEYEIRVSSASMLPTIQDATCTVSVGRGRLANFTSLPAGSDPLAVTVAESSGHVYVVDLTAGMTHRYDKTLTFVDTIVSPFGAALTPGLTWRPGAAMADPGTLFWYNADAGMLQETDLDGVLIGTAVPLSSPANGAVADITYSAATDTFWGVDITMDVYFEFLADGTVTGNEIAGSDFGVGAMSIGNGVTAVGMSAALDAPVGEFATGFADQVGRVATDTGMAIGENYSLVPSTGSAFINGIAYTPVGSDGNPSEFLVGNDTGTLYELSLKLPGVGFVRGDVDQNGSIELTDAINIIQFVFNIAATPDCLDAADANDDGSVNVTDGPFLLQFVFNIGSPPPLPFGVCGLDPTNDPIDCASFTACP